MERLTAILSAALLLCSCSGELFDRHKDRFDRIDDVSHDMIVLGEKLDDPYTVENMTKALVSLYPTKADRVSVDPTDWYVRLLPGSDEVYGRLCDMGVVMMDHPMDYEIVKDGDYYHDPELPEDAITWQYALVPVGFEFPEGVEHEILDDCYIPEHDHSTKAEAFDWDAVEAESYRLTGNADMLPEPLVKGRTDYSPAVPSGRIAIIDRAQDDEPIGVKGVRVMCNSFVRVSTCYTDDGGYWTMKKQYSSKLRYRLVFRNTNGFCIGLNLLLIPASTSALGSHGPEGVSVVIDEKSEKRLFSRCVVNNAAYDWWQSCKYDGMDTTPSDLRLWLFQKLGVSCPLMMRQGVLIDGSSLGDLLGEYTSIVRMFLPDMVVGLKDKEDYASIYAETMHQVAHASHFNEVGVNWWDSYLRYTIKSYVTSGFTAYGSGMGKDAGYCRIAEMWAYYAQTRMFRNRYEDSDQVFGTQFWFSPQLFLYLDERGLPMGRIIKALSSDVYEMDMLQKKLLSLYPEYKTHINQAFARYN